MVGAVAAALVLDDGAAAGVLRARALLPGHIGRGATVVVAVVVRGPLRLVVHKTNEVEKFIDAALLASHSDPSCHILAPNSARPGRTMVAPSSAATM